MVLTVVVAMLPTRAFSQPLHRRCRVGPFGGAIQIWEHGGDIRRANRREGGLHVREGPPGPEPRNQPNAEHAERTVQH
jgi:hypothetical protein